MAAAAFDRDTSRRQPGELVAYTGTSGYRYYRGTMVIRSAVTGFPIPAVSGAGASNAKFLGVAETSVDRTTDTGASQAVLQIWKHGEFEFAANGTGASADIGQRAYAVDDQTVGTSAFGVYVGEITGIPSTSLYRVRIDGAVNMTFASNIGVSWSPSQQ